MSTNARVLIVDPDPCMARILSAALATPGWTITVCGSVGAASEALQAAPDLVVATAELPSRGAERMLATLRTLPGRRPPVLLHSDRAAAAEARTLVTQGADVVLSRPFAPEELTTAAARLAAGGGGLEVRGKLVPGSFANLVRRFVFERRTAALKLVVSSSRSPATLEFDGGRLVHASFGLLHGAAAFFQLLVHPRGRFEATPSPPRGPRNIEWATLPLLMEGFRLLDARLIRRIDPDNEAAASGVQHSLELAAEPVSPLLEPSEEPTDPTGSVRRPAAPPPERPAFPNPPSMEQTELNVVPLPDAGLPAERDLDATPDEVTVYKRIQPPPARLPALQPLSRVAGVQPPPPAEEAPTEFTPGPSGPTPHAPAEVNALDTMEYAAHVVGWDDPTPTPPAITDSDVTDEALPDSMSELDRQALLRRVAGDVAPPPGGRDRLEQVGRDEPIELALGGADEPIELALGGDDAIELALGGDDEPIELALGGDDAIELALGGDDEPIELALGGDDAIELGGDDEPIELALGGDDEPIELALGGDDEPFELALGGDDEPFELALGGDAPIELALGEGPIELELGGDHDPVGRGDVEEIDAAAGGDEDIERALAAYDRAFEEDGEPEADESIDFEGLALAAVAVDPAPEPPAAPAAAAPRGREATVLSKMPLPSLPALSGPPVPPVVHVDPDASDDDLPVETLVRGRALDPEEGMEELDLWGEDDESDDWGSTDSPGPEESGVALVTDTWMRLPTDHGSGRRDLMVVYETLKKIARRQLSADSVQLGTLEGYVIASTIRKLKRRDTVGAFSAQAMEFAREDAAGRRFTVLDAGKTHVFVVEIDHKRLLTMLFDERPDAQVVMAALRPALEEIRGGDTL